MKQRINKGAKERHKGRGGEPLKDYVCPREVRTTKKEVVLTNLEMTAKKEDKEVKREESVVRQARGHVGVPIPTLAAHNPDTGSVS